MKYNSKLFLTIKEENTIKIHVVATQSIHILTTYKSQDTHQLLIRIEVLYMLHDLQFTILQWSDYESITLFFT